MMWSSRPIFLIRSRTKTLPHIKATVKGKGTQRKASRAAALLWLPLEGVGRGSIAGHEIRN